MNQNLSQNTLQIIEVPQELRGMTDEEIIQNSERIKKDFSGSRKNGAARPSKRDRLALKTKQAHQEIQDLAAEIFGNKQPAPSPVEVLKLNPEKQEMLRTAFTPESHSFSTFSSEPKQKLHSMISEVPKPASGRILKASFGVKGKDQPKAVIVNAADLAKQKAEERTKKIQAAFKAKHPEATDMPDGTPVKRGRGRPRKNPLP